MISRFFEPLTESAIKKWMYRSSAASCFAVSVVGASCRSNLPEEGVSRRVRSSHEVPVELVERRQASRPTDPG